MSLTKTYAGVSANGYTNTWFSQFGGWGQQARLRQGDPGSGIGVSGDHFGNAIAISADGNTVAIAASDKYNSSTTPYRGAVYIFVRSGASWTQQAKLLAADGTSYNQFGQSLSISSDGNYLAIGRSNNNSLYPTGATTQGSVYIFIRSGTTWTQQTKITPSIGVTYYGFGMGVYIDSTANTMISFAAHQISGAWQYNVYIFTRSGTTWTQATTISVDQTPNGDNFIISGDGTKIIIGNSNSAKVYTGSGSSWTLQATLNSPTYPSIGSARLTTNSDGSVATILFDKFYIFTRSGSTWTAAQTITYADTQQNSIAFEYPLTMSSDGSTIIIGAFQDAYKPSTWNGAFYIFRKVNTTWIEVGKIYATTAQQNKDEFPSALGINSNGNTIIAGASKDIWGSSGYENGSAYVFVK